MKRTFSLIVLLLLLAAVAGAQSPSGDGTSPITASRDASKGWPSYFPPFSWERVPLYQQCDAADHLFTDAEVAKIASESDFICIEKTHGIKVLGAADLGTKHEIPRFKALNPHLKCLFYFNSAYAYPFTTYSQMFRYEAVNGSYKSFLLSDPKTGELYHRGDVYFFDVLNPSFEMVGRYGGQVCAGNQCGRPVCGPDARLCPPPSGKAKEVAQAQAELMRMAKEAIGPDKMLLLNNGAHIPALFEVGDAFMFEHYDPKLLTKEAIVKDWGLLKKISQAGKISVWRIGMEIEHPDIAQANRNTESANAAYEALAKKELPFHLAVFLIGAQPNSYLQYGWGWVLKSGPLAEYPEFKNKLGKPLGDYTRANPDGWIFQRKFEHASVWVDLNQREGRIEWK